MTFDDLLAVRAELQAAHDLVWKNRHVAQAALDAALVAAAKMKGGKRVTIKNVEKHLSADAIAAIRAPFQEAYDLAYDVGFNALEANKLALHAASEAAEFSPIASRTEWQLWKSVWVSSYSTQGYGAAKYAKNNAESYADKARRYGIEVDVSRDDDEKFYVYVKVAPGERDTALLGYKPEETLREWVKKCWSRGSNPRVLNPWLPHGYEEREGLDYFGGEVKK